MAGFVGIVGLVTVAVTTTTAAVYNHEPTSSQMLSADRTTNHTRLPSEKSHLSSMPDTANLSNLSSTGIRSGTKQRESRPPTWTPQLDRVNIYEAVIPPL
ncbi:hypothetical protein O6H91_08G086800 [Diphasiastrum complanatum]|uniref:Uncharacterized protein n=1 Tax=Diphasiastrum complanatum TaxID=34168 RepID=A0ACC2CZJ4_DIPCM|nr:hypothetical protein O6H91_08G086800 [Diphasiastrum complanatum]